MIVLDTHVLIWAVQDDAKLGVEAARIIETAAVEEGIAIPAICAWEIAFAEKRGRVILPGGGKRWLEAILDRSGFILSPLTTAIAMRSVWMEWDHRDPADRMIAATAIEGDHHLLTADGEILAYAAQGHLKAIDARR